MIQDYHKHYELAIFVVLIKNWKVKDQIEGRLRHMCVMLSLMRSTINEMVLTV